MLHRRHDQVFPSHGHHEPVALSLTPLLPVDTVREADELVVCIDPGHSPLAGGRYMQLPAPDSGAAVILAEWEINLDVALEVTRRLRARYVDDAVAIVLTWGEVDGRSRPWRAASALRQRALQTRAGGLGRAHRTSGATTTRA